jgi:ANTAR domain-containing protein
MSLDDSGLAIAEQATRALGSLERYGHVLRPPGTHEMAWRVEMLDELARAGHRLVGAVARVVGDDDPAVEGILRELSSAIDLHCDRVLRTVRDRPGPTSGRGVPERVVPFPTPYVRPRDDGSRPAAPAVDPSVQRTVIGTAAEMLMARHACGVDAAYALILERARDTGTSTYEVAARVVEED